MYIVLLGHPQLLLLLLLLFLAAQVLAKLGSSQNKPNKQAIVLPRGVRDMMQVRSPHLQMGIRHEALPRPCRMARGSSYSWGAANRPPHTTQLANPCAAVCPLCWNAAHPSRQDLGARRKARGDARTGLRCHHCGTGAGVSRRHVGNVFGPGGRQIDALRPMITPSEPAAMSVYAPLALMPQPLFIPQPHTTAAHTPSRPRDSPRLPLRSRSFRCSSFSAVWARTRVHMCIKG